MFDEKSRYARLQTYKVNDRRGRVVAVVPVPEHPLEVSLGIHMMRQGHRLDHLAFKYLDDPAGFWRICELNDVMLPESLKEAREIAIPQKRKMR